MSRRTVRLRRRVRQALRVRDEKGKLLDGTLNRAAVRDFLARNGRQDRFAMRPERQERLAAATVGGR